MRRLAEQAGGPGDSMTIPRRNADRGFTLIELVVVLGILGILIALAVPRYLGTRRSAPIAEGDNVLQELKTLSWAYYQQYSTWVGIVSTNMATTFGFTAPATGCWSYDLAVAGAATQIQLRANDEPLGRAACGPLPGTGVITLTLTATGRPRGCRPACNPRESAAERAANSRGSSMQVAPLWSHLPHFLSLGSRVCRHAWTARQRDATLVGGCTSSGSGVWAKSA